MTKFDTSIYILQIAVMMDVMLKILRGTTNQHLAEPLYPAVNKAVKTM